MLSQDSNLKLTYFFFYTASLLVSLLTTPAFGNGGSKAFLTAIITSEVPVEFIIWQRVGADNSTTPLDLTTEKYTQIGNLEQVSVTLIINNLTLGDSGSYMVYVKSSAGTTNTSNQVIVSVVEGTYMYIYVWFGLHKQRVSILCDFIFPLSGLAIINNIQRVG